MCHPDTMHCKHSGTDSYFLGSVLKYLVLVIIPAYLGIPSTPQACLDLFWQKAKEHMERTDVKSQFIEMRLSMFMGDHFPMLK